MSTGPLEHVRDLSTGQAVDQDYTGTGFISGSHAQAEAEQRRMQALAALRVQAACLLAEECGTPVCAREVGEVIRDLLIVLGVDG
jgi:hypothetical protein